MNEFLFFFIIKALYFIYLKNFLVSKMRKLFFSYLNELQYENLLLRLVQELQNESFVVYFNKNKLITENNVEIKETILKSDIILCFITNKYIQDGNCRLELFFANHQNKKCIYIFFEKIESKLTNDICIYLHGNSYKLDAFKFNKDDCFNQVLSHLKLLIHNCESINYDLFDNSVEIKRDDFFYGREDIIHQLETHVIENKGVCLVGESGVGKTSCVVEFIHRSGKNILWFNSESEIKILDKIFNISHKIEAINDFPIQAFLEYVNHSKNILLVFDNLINISDLTNILKLSLLKVPYIITTNLSLEGDKRLHIIELHSLNNHQAALHLSNLAPNLSEKRIDKIVKKLRIINEDMILPFQLNLVSGLIHENFNDEQIIKVFKTDVYAKTAVKILDAYCNDEIKLLKIITLLDVDYIPFELLKRIPFKNPLKLSLQKISKLNLLTLVFPNSPSKFGVRMQNIYQKDFQCFFENHESYKIENDIYVEIMEAILDMISIDYSASKNSIQQAFKIMNNKNILHETNLSMDIYEILADYCAHYLQNYEQEFKYRFEALKIKKKLLNIQNISEDIKPLRTNLFSSDQLTDNGTKLFDSDKSDLTAIIEKNEDSINEKPESEGSSKSANLGESLNETALSYERYGDFKKSIEFKKKALVLKLKHYDTELHPDVIKSLKSIAYTYTLSGENKSALEYKENVLDIRKKLNKTKDNADVAKTLNR
jgi:ABC-type dipeptide/oligopeptide/nickel transport system ATPase subunit